MRFLLDTQVFIWLINEDKRLGKVARQLLQDSSNSLVLSYFSIFEMTIKSSIGKLTYDPSIIDDLPSIGIELLLPNEKTLQNYQAYASNNKDPFDNALITAALNESLAFVTGDQKILQASINELAVVDATQ